MLSLFLCAALTAAPQATPPASTSALSQEKDLKEVYKERRDAAEGDVEKLWKLVDWCEANGLSKETRSCLRAILKLDEDDKKAHELLGHVYYDGQWFTSEKKLADFKKKNEARIRAEEEKVAKEKGLVRYKDGWVRPEEIPFLDRGMVKDEFGDWIDPEEVELLAAGWVRQDLDWVSPEDKAKIQEGLWQCEEDWLSLEEANAFHAELGQWWRIPGGHYVLYTTTPRDVAQDALNNMESTYGDLVKVFGVYPVTKPHVVLLNSPDQYSLFASGSEEHRLQPTEAQALSSVHGAYFAEAWFDQENQTFQGAGVAYWDVNDENGASFGRLWGRHAAAQSFIEAVDPSPKAIARTFEVGEFPLEDFWSEKLIPTWLRYGASAYVERYYVDSYVGPDGNPFWAREWSVSNLLRQGGLGEMDGIFEFGLTVDDPEASAKLILEAGLLVSFIIDGGCPPVKQQHQAVKAAFKEARTNPEARKDLLKEFEKLEKVIKKNEDKLAAFAGL